MDHANSTIVYLKPKDYSPFYLKIAAVLLIVSVLLVLVQLVLWVASVSISRSDDQLPISIRSIAQADYERDLNEFVIPPFSANLLNQIILDMPATGDPQDRIATLQAGLSTPVSTMTLNSQPVTPTPTNALPTPAFASTTVPTLGIPTIINVPSLIPTNLALPTIPPLLPTTPPLIPTSLPLPTIPLLP